MTAGDDRFGQGFAPRQTDLSSNTRSHGDVARLLADVGALALPHSATVERAQARLALLSERLARGRLQLAVVGQFKRGKSTLLNALLGAAVLPSAVTPLTAIPTFVRGGPTLKLLAEHRDGRREEHEFQTRDALAEQLTQYVTEDGNRENRLGIARVDVEMPAALLEGGVTLIDTPGVGSTFAHNTETAKATLPECDAALFVVSPDPPITEVEIAYLKDLRAMTSNIVIVLNKIDIVEGQDRTRSERFLHDALATVGLGEAPYFAVSARTALRESERTDAPTLAESGIKRLESFLREFVRTRRDAVLAVAIARRAAAAVREIAFEVQCRIAALKLPIDDLSDKLAQFGADERSFARERNASRDLLAGDRTRMLNDLDDQAEKLRNRVYGELHREIDEQVERGESEALILEGLRARLPVLFQAEFERFEADARLRLETLLAVHQERGDALISKVRQRAADLLAIPFAAPEASDAFVAKKSPFWVTDPRESLSPVPAGALDAVLAPVARWRRVRDRLSRQVDEVVLRNVENLRWTIRQNLEEAIRGFQMGLDERLRLSQIATREALELGLNRRQRRQDEAKDELVQLTEVDARLTAIADALER